MSVVVQGFFAVDRSRLESIGVEEDEQEGGHCPLACPVGHSCSRMFRRRGNHVAPSTQLVFVSFCSSYFCPLASSRVDPSCVRVERACRVCRRARDAPNLSCCPGPSTPLPTHCAMRDEASLAAASTPLLMSDSSMSVVCVVCRSRVSVDDVPARSPAAAPLTRRPSDPTGHSQTHAHRYENRASQGSKGELGAGKQC